MAREGEPMTKSLEEMEAAWECACGARFVEEADARAHIAPGHPWLSRMVDGNLGFLHGPDPEWWAAETTTNSDEATSDA